MRYSAVYLRFLKALLPTLHELARDAFERHGDVEKAKLELRAIGEHGARMHPFDAELAARMAKLKAKEGTK